ncbi:MAG: acylphosphatase [Candidatus Omnitrophica bacterium]|nr:acylphosphatase [Candidatus Omnitrophota bacterium]
MAKKRLHAFFSGNVQGVGFRFTAVDVADDLGVNGRVRNLRDGRVELIAEADEETLKDFLTRINQYFSRYIRDADIEWLEASDEFKDFGIGY